MSQNQRINNFLFFGALFMSAMLQDNSFEGHLEVSPKIQKKPVQKKGVNAYYFDGFGEIIGINNEPSTKYLCRIEAINKKNALRKFAKRIPN